MRADGLGFRALGALSVLSAFSDVEGRGGLWGFGVSEFRGFRTLGLRVSVLRALSWKIGGPWSVGCQVNLHCYQKCYG